MPLLSLLLALLALAIAPRAANAQAEGLVGVRIDQERNRLYLSIPAAQLGRDLLYQNTLVTGLGVNRLGLDRGQTGTNEVIRFERRGNRILIVLDNWNVRALGGNAALERSARESFPSSVIASFPIESSEGGVVTIDASSFFLSDAYGVIGRVRQAQQGTLRVDRDRSWIDPDHTGAFPRNAEIRAVLTYVTDAPGADLNRAAPDGGAVTVAQHHSIVALPSAEGFRPRAFDLRAGLFGNSFLDFAEGFDGDYRNAYASRWRLVPRDRAAYLRGELVEPEQPIVYYLDPAIPEPYRTAFREGGMWWSGVFQAAGFRNAFQIRDLPAGANPMDARYPMIYWVHRVGPGPSVGPSYRDPRTGEILSTVVRMDSHRSLIDYNIYAGLVPAAGAQGLSVSAEAFAMARRRQHTAHEIGHTLGLQHNFIAASQGRASFMDYPFPLITLNAQGRIELGDAYRVGGGAWDSLAVRYAYTWFPDEAAEQEGLRRIMADGLAKGLRYITGGHASAAGSIPEATQWVEGATMFEAVERTSRVRRVLIDRFDERAIAPGEPMSFLNQRFAHVYLHHRYSLEGVIKYVGGMDFTYAVRGDGQTPARVLPAAEQRRGLAMALAALEPAELAIPARIADLIPPSPPGTDGAETWIPTAAGSAFDPVTLAGGLATEVIENLLHPQRAQRLVLFHLRDASNPSLSEVIRALVDASWGAAPASDRMHQALRRTVQRVALNTMLDLAGDARTSAEARAVAASEVARLGARIEAMQGGSAEDQGHRALALKDIRRFAAGEDDRASRPRFPVVPLPWP